ncbi:hypothetical protein PMAC_001849 [Pneumocystis sp. 'macacae']|nr:hypothetical protein PMAC_001849 [Pneumocystis sp. 'macacae']
MLFLIKLAEYEHRPGALRLKGGEPNKKRKRTAAGAAKVESGVISGEKIGPNITSVGIPAVSTLPTKTPTEQRFEEIWRKRMDERVQKTAAKSHRERVAEFNKKLSELSEHNDIPKVGPG